MRCRKLAGWPLCSKALIHADDVIERQAMLKRPAVIIIAILITVIGFVVYTAYRVPPGVAPKSNSAETIAWILKNDALYL